MINIHPFSGGLWQARDVPKAASHSTIPETVSTDRLRRARMLRNTFVFLLFAFLVTALTGLLGVRTSTKRASAQGYDVTVTYGAMTRPGLATPFDVEVVRTGGHKEPVTLAVSNDFMAAFDENGLDPDPAITRADADFVYWTFEVPPGDTLGVSFDARLEPAVQWKRPGTVRLIRESETLLEIGFTMWVMP
jgi:hypothetical protein